MTPYCHSYTGWKCSRHYRFPALPYDHRTRAFTSAQLLPAGNSRAFTYSNYEDRTLEVVTICRGISIEIETVKPDHAETDRLQKSGLFANGRRQYGSGGSEL